MTQNIQQPETFDLIGNLGNDPKSITWPARKGTKKVYDHIIDEVVDREFDDPERHFLVFSLCSGGYGDKPERWFNCVDWEGTCFRLRKGDKVRLTGYLQNRTYRDKKSGELKEVRQFVVVAQEILKLKTREAA